MRRKLNSRSNARHWMLAMGALAATTNVSTAMAQSQNKPAHPLLRNDVLPQTLGVNIHFTDAKAGETEMLVRGGFRWVRMDLTWGSTEKQKGVYDFSAYDRLMKSLDSNKVRPYFILDYGNLLYSPQSARQPATEAANTPEFRAAYAKWAAAAVTHFKNRGVIWEIWNEPNHQGFWKPKPNVQDYSLLALEACRAIRAVAPAECIIGPATSTVDLAFLEACFRNGLLEHWDGVSVHPYRQSAPETAGAELRQLRVLIERFKPKGKNIPVVSGEWGFSSAWNNFNPDLQGKYLPRELLTNQLNEIPISIWYDWHNDGTDPKEAEHNFGTVEFEYRAGQADVYKPKPAYIAHKTMSDTLNGFRFNKRLWTGRDDEYVLLFSRDNNREVRIAAWTSDTKARQWTLPASNGTFKSVNYLGQVLADVAATNNALKLNLSDTVQYLWPAQSNAMLQGAAKIARVPLERISRAPFAVTSRINVIGSVLGRGQDIEYRDSEPLQVLADTTINGAKYQQQTQLIVSNPLRAIALPSVGKVLPIRIENPTGEAFKGAIQVVANGKTLTQNVELPLGQTELIVPIAVDAPVETVRVQALMKSSPEAISVPLLSNIPLVNGLFTHLPNHQPVTSEVSVRMQSVDDFARAGANGDYAVVPEGDAKVVSTQSVSVGNAPEALFGQTVAALKLDYKWDAGWKFVQVLPPNTLKLEGTPRALQMWIYGDGNGHRARLRVRDSGGQTLQPNGVAVDWKGWKAVTFPLDGSQSGFWGGANDGKVHGALSWDTLFLLDSNRNASQGTIYIAQPTLVYDAK